MVDKHLQRKLTYFQRQALLDLSDDEGEPRGTDLSVAPHLLGESPAMSQPPPPVRRGSSFLGPTPRERQQEFEHHATKQRAVGREPHPRLTPSSTAPKLVTQSSSAASAEQAHPQAHGRSKRTASLPAFIPNDNTLFYKLMGDIPRELKSTNAKAADNIAIVPEHRQLLKERIVYFFPNDDVSMARRLRIHKIIQLGAAWVKRWREDVTHIMLDDDTQTYQHLLRHLNKTGLSNRIVVAKFDPYIPQCIQSALRLDPNQARFLVKGAPRLCEASTLIQRDSQTSFIKSSARGPATRLSQETDSPSTEITPPQEEMDGPSIPSETIVRDSFPHATAYPTAHVAKLPTILDDELSMVIQQTRTVAHLLFDDEEEEDSRRPTRTVIDSGSSTDKDHPQYSPMRRGNLRADVTSRQPSDRSVVQSTFQCMNPLGTSLTTSNPNARTIDILQQMGRYYDQMQDQWRTLAYRKAVTILQKQTAKISTAKDAAALPFIGPRLADKIEEIVLTDRLRRLDNTRDDPTDNVLRLFLGVYGAGIVQANKWISSGYRTLDDLLAKAKLTDSQKIGIEHYQDFATRIPRAEVKAHGDHVKDVLQQIDAACDAIIMGSYRRGAKDSGDIDIIITKPGATVSTLRDVVFNRLVPRLLKTGFLKVKLATSSSTDDGTKWHGASCLPSSTTWRRLDLLLVPEEEMGAALLYFTGNDIFNRSIRLLASKKGMRLNQRGLYKDVIRGRNREKINEGTLVEGRDEKAIFKILGVPWREPTERIC